MSHGEHIVIFANGDLPKPERVRRLVQPGDYIICADGGTRHALKLGVKPQLVIGDMDSLTRKEIEELKRTDVRFELYPPDKNETDLELALRLARDRSPESILVIALGGGRIDQTLANLSLLTDPALAGIQVRADDGVEEILFCRSNAEILGNPGETVSLLPSGGPATGLRSQGLRWPLNGDTLFPEKSRGVSNELLDRTASVSIESGLLLIVHRHQT